MKKVYACLVGQWVCLNDDPSCVMGDNRANPFYWWEENASIYAPQSRNKDLEDSAYSLDYINIHYKGKDYRINPIFIQIVTE